MRIRPDESNAKRAPCRILHIQPRNHGRQALLAQGINVHVSAAGDSRLEVESRDVSRVVRPSVHYYKSEDGIERLCATLEKV